MPRRLSRPPDARAILITGVEGGGATLYGRETADGWEYYVEYVDQTPLMPAKRPASLHTRPNADDFDGRRSVFPNRS